MKIFIAHYSKLTDRKNSILEQFKIQNITDYEFIELFDKDELTDKETLKYSSKLKKSEISIMLKHLYIYQQIAQNESEYALIFEDDVILSSNFTDKLEQYVSQLPKDFDMLFIGDGCNLHIEKHVIQPNKYTYEKCLHPTSWGGNGATRCCDSYIVSKKCAAKLCNYLQIVVNINLPIDWWLNEAARDNNLKIFWAEPTIVTQGSQNNIFKSYSKVN